MYMYEHLYCHFSYLSLHQQRQRHDLGFTALQHLPFYSALMEAISMQCSVCGISYHTHLTVTP